MSYWKHFACHYSFKVESIQSIKNTSFIFIFSLCSSFSNLLLVIPTSTLMTTLCVPASRVPTCACLNGILLERAFEGLPSIHLGKPNLTNLHHLHHGLTGQRGRHCSKLLLTRVGPKKTPTSSYLITFSHNSSNFDFLVACRY